MLNLSCDIKKYLSIEFMLDFVKKDSIQYNNNYQL